MRLLLTLLVTCLLAACASKPLPSQNATRWIGAKKQDLTHAWGPPTLIAPLANHDTLYEYQKTVKHPFPAPGTSDGVMVVGKKTIGFSVPGNPEKYVIHCFTYFTISAQGTVKSVQQRGAACH